MQLPDIEKVSAEVHNAWEQKQRMESIPKNLKMAKN